MNHKQTPLFEKLSPSPLCFMMKLNLFPWNGKKTKFQNAV